MVDISQKIKSGLDDVDLRMLGADFLARGILWQENTKILSYVIPPTFLCQQVLTLASDLICI